jgi:hypothetical protein
MTGAGSVVKVIAITALCVPVAACGSSKSNSSSTSSKPAITKAQFLAQGNAICTKGDARQNADVVAYAKAHHISLKKMPTRAQLVALVRHVSVPDIQASISSLRALGAPKGDEQKVTAMLDASQQALDRIRQNPSLLAGNTSPFTGASGRLHSYGLIECAKNA